MVENNFRLLDQKHAEKTAKEKLQEATSAEETHEKSLLEAREIPAPLGEEEQGKTTPEKEKIQLEKKGQEMKKIPHIAQGKWKSTSNNDKEQS